MIKASIIGGAGYAGGELLRLLLLHPEVSVYQIQSVSQQGKLVSSIHKDLLGFTDLKFVNSIDLNADVYFITAGHGASISFLKEHPTLIEKPVIDFSQDHRLKSQTNNFIYGLPELNRSLIRENYHIANPGCFATAIQLALLPLADNGSLKDAVHVNAITGSTGAGQKLRDTSHFSWRSDNISIYKPFSHQHLAEIRESLQQLDPQFNYPVHFVPFRGDFTRGIFASIYTLFNESNSKLNELYEDYYSTHPFVQVTNDNPALKQVINTNNAIIYVKTYNGQAHIICLIDNLIKGAAGQAVQNLNLVFGIEETTGLHLKPSSF